MYVRTYIGIDFLSQYGKKKGKAKVETVQISNYVGGGEAIYL